MSTIADVARKAGVSVSTISNVLNGRADRMSAETLMRVEAAITALNYRPNRAAQQLKTGQTPMFGLLVPSIANPMYGMIAREIETAAQERHGHRVMLGNTYRNKDKESGFFDDLLAHGVRGVVVISSLVDERHFEAAVKRGMVMVSYDRRATPGVASAIDHVSVDNFEAAQLAAQHLIAKGHRRIAFATATGYTMSRSEKVRGFFAAAEAAGVRRDARVIDGSTHSDYGDSEMADVGPFARRAHRRAARAPDRRGGGERHAGLRPARRLSRCRPGGAARRVGDRHGRAVPVVADQPGSHHREPAGARHGAHDRRAPDRTPGRPGGRTRRVPVQAVAGAARVGRQAAGGAKKGKA